MHIELVFLAFLCLILNAIYIRIGSSVLHLPRSLNPFETARTALITSAGPVLVLILLLLMGMLFGTKGSAVGFMLAPLTKPGVVTGLVVELVLTTAEVWNFTDGHLYSVA